MTDAARTIAARFRIELPKRVARLARVVRDVGRAEALCARRGVDAPGAAAAGVHASMRSGGAIVAGSPWGVAAAG